MAKSASEQRRDLGIIADGLESALAGFLSGADELATLLRRLDNESFGIGRIEGHALSAAAGYALDYFNDDPHEFEFDALPLSKVGDDVRAVAAMIRDTLHKDGRALDAAVSA